MDHLRTTAIIVGGGPVGLTAALALTRASIDFILLERRKEVVVEEGSDMTILPMTMRAVDQMNLLEPLSKVWNPVSEISRIDHRGRGIGEFRVFQYLRENTGHYPYVLSRKNLLSTLYQALPKDAQSQIFTNKTITGIHNSPDSVTVSCTDGTKYCGKFIIGADGAYSAVRTSMRNLALDSGMHNVNDVNPFTTTYQALWIRFPTERLPSCKPGSATETHGSGIATQLFVGEKTATAGIYKKLPRPKRTSMRYTEKDEAALVQEFGHLPLLQKTGSDTPICLKDAYEARLGSGLVDLEEGVLQHWSWNGRIVLVGDAAHKFTPSTGSGVNFGMIDSVVLVNHLHTLSKAHREGDNAWDTTSLSQQERYEDVKAGCQQSSGATAMATWANVGLMLLDQYLLPTRLVQWLLGMRIAIQARSNEAVGFRF
ncbi:FAD binding domain-containing protein [Colletotrichum camelliae]|nr:FAD binding domain-containing protein [Colletotrichum camelliae]